MKDNNFQIFNENPDDADKDRPNENIPEIESLPHPQISKRNDYTKQKKYSKRIEFEGESSDSDQDDSSSMRKKWIEFYLGHIKGNKYLTRINIMTSCTLFGLIFYLISLEGGDNDWLNAHVQYLGKLILTSVTFFTVSIYLVIAAEFPAKKKCKLLFGIMLIAFLMFIYDQGTVPEVHGQINSILFLALFIPINLFFYTYRAFYNCCPKSCHKITLGLIISISIPFYILTKYFQAQYPIGLLGISAVNIVDGKNVCPLDPAIPYPDFFFDGLLNFWIGSQTCPPNDVNFDAYIQDETLYVANCPKEMSISYILNPDTRNWTREDKIVNIFPKVLDKFWIDIPYKEPSKIPQDCESLVVKCGNSKKLVTQLKARPTPFWTQVNQNEEFKPDDVKINGMEKPFNVVIVYIDSVSRRQLQRKMRATVNAIESLHRPGKHRVYQFLRHNANEVYTDSNTNQMYTGQRAKANDTFNPPHVVWKDFYIRGYTVSWMTNDCDDWGVRCLNKTASEFVTNEYNAPFCDADYYDREIPWGLFKGPYSITRRCMYGDYVHKPALAYMKLINELYKPGGKGSEAFGRKKNGVPYFAIHSFMEGHEFTMEVIRLLDDDLAKVLHAWDEEKFFENTVMFVASDHGSHDSLSYIFARNGWIENKNPFLIMVLPEWISQYNNGEFHEALMHNSQVLSGHLDTYHTLSALARWGDWKGGEGVSKEVEEIAKSHLKQSFFTKKDPLRTCADLDIPEKNCWCENKGVINHEFRD